MFQSFTIQPTLEGFAYDEEGKLRRAAISHAINRAELTEVIFQGTRTPAEDFTSPVIAGFDPEAVEGSEVMEYDPELAKELWAQADAIRPWAGTFQLARIPDALDARDNVAVAAMYGRRRLDIASARAEADRLLDRVGFAGARAAHADALTYFDHKRIELARALACAPDLLLLDEWLAGLNPTELEAGIDLVRSLNADGLTIVMVEHVMHAIRSLCGHVVVLSAGRVIAAGTPDEALADPGVVRVYLGEAA